MAGSVEIYQKNDNVSYCSNYVIIMTSFLECPSDWKLFKKLFIFDLVKLKIGTVF